MEKNTIICILVIIVIWTFFFQKQKFQGLNAEEWFSEYTSSESNLKDYEKALEEANNRIDEVNSDIRTAKMSVGDSFEEMQDALNNLDTVGNIAKP